MKLIISLAMLFAASSQCFSMKKRAHDFDADPQQSEQQNSKLKTNGHFTKTNQSKKRSSAEENNNPNHKPFAQHIPQNHDNPGTQIQVYRLNQQQQQNNQNNPQFITILRLDGTYQYLPLN